MVSRRRGTILLEFVAALAVLSILGLSAAALLRAQARDQRALFDERAAAEAAAGELELLEARAAALPAGTDPVPLALPDLKEAVVLRRVEPAADGLRRVRVEVSWTDAFGARRRVEAATLLPAGEGR